MSKPIANLLVKIGADTRGVESGGKRANRSMKDMEDHAKKTAKALAGIAVAATGAMAGLTAHAAAASKEIEYLSQVAGTTPKRFQDLAYGAKTVGIETEKLADIYKDARDRVGDFITTGGGPMLDFFEQVAPKVGLTAKEFQHLSGPEVMQKFVKALEDANLSASEQVFYMEAMASDSARLLPLLRDNAKALNDLAAESDKLGMSLSTMQIEKMSELDDAMKRLSGTVRGSFTAGYIEGFVDEFDDFSSMAQDPELAEAIQNLGTLFGTMARDSLIFLSESVKQGQRLIDMTNDVATPNERLGYMEKFGEMVLGVDPEIEKQRDLVKQMMGEDQADLQMQYGMENQVVDIFARFQNEGGQDFNKFMGLEGNPFDQQFGTQEAWDEGAATRLERLQEHLMSERELEEQSHKENLDLLAAAERSGNLEISKWQELEAKEKARHEKKITDIEEQQRRARMAGAVQFANNALSLMQTGTMEQFGIAKAAAIAQALLAQKESIIDAYKWGSKIGGPPGGAIAAGLATAATVAMVSDVKSASFTGGGGVSSRGFGASAGAAQQVARAGAVPQQAQTQTIRVQTTGGGDNIPIASVRELFDTINEGTRNGLRLIID